MLAVLGRSWDLCWQSWAALGPYVGGLGAVLGPMLAVLGCLGAYVGGLGPLLGPMLGVLGRSWGLRRRSWDGIMAKSGPKPEKWPKPEQKQGAKGVGPPEATETLSLIHI